MQEKEIRKENEIFLTLVSLFDKMIGDLEIGTGEVEAISIDTLLDMVKYTYNFLPSKEDYEAYYKFKVIRAYCEFCYIVYIVCKKNGALEEQSLYSIRYHTSYGLYCLLKLCKKAILLEGHRWKMPKTVFTGVHANTFCEHIGSIIKIYEMITGLEDYSPPIYKNKLSELESLVEEFYATQYELYDDSEIIRWE